MASTPAQIVELLCDHAAKIATEGNGLPLHTFRLLANVALEQLVCYGGYHPERNLRMQDVDYLARLFQSVFVMMQDFPGEVR